MTALENFVSPALTRALGWTLLHSLWQGALVAAVLAGALLLLRRQRAEVRYVASAGALGTVVALAGITFGLYFNSGAEHREALRPSAANVLQLRLPRTETQASVGADAMPVQLPTAADRQTTAAGPVKTPPPMGMEKATSSNWLVAGLRYFDNHLPLLVMAWLLGLLAMSLRMLGGLLYVQRLKRYRVRAVSAAWQERLAALLARGGLRRPVELLESALVQVPLVVGHVRPVILLPLGAVAGLSVAHLEAILAHEVAHVLRRDYLVNLLQTVAEALFFYHPAVWFMARCVRTERENCCDDLATALCGGDALRLARALTALAEWSQSAVVATAPRLALAAMGGRGALLNRVRRLVQRRPAALTLAEGFMAGALVLGGLGLLGGSVALAGPLAGKPAAADWQTGPAAARPNGAADTTKRATNTTTTTNTTTSSATPDPASAARRAVSVMPAADGNDPDQDRPRRRDRRASRNGQLVPPSALAGNAGTVIITKDKKGRVTDLVVNGQRVETATGKQKLKIKASKEGGDLGQSVQINQVPMEAPEARAFVYRSDEEGQRRLFERSTGRNQTFQYQLQPLRNEQFRALTFSKNRGFQRVEVAPGESVNRTFRVQPGTFNLRQDGGGEREALRSAERALQDASTAKNLTAAQRKRIGESLEKVRAQLKQPASATASRPLRLSGEQPAALRERQQELQARMQDLQERILEVREEGQNNVIEERQEVASERADRARARAERERRHAERDRAHAEHRRGQDDALVAELLKDGLIADKGNFQFKLTASSLTVNGKTQPASVFQKYRKLHERSTGRQLIGNNAVVMTRNSDSSTIIGNNDVPTPPRPPRAPRAPQAPGAMMAPAPPLAPPAPMSPPPPPVPPRIDSEALRSELRKDGLIGAADKSFQLQLNGSGLSVNGKAQSADAAAKYRKLLGHEKGTYNMTITND